MAAVSVTRVTLTLFSTMMSFCLSVFEEPEDVEDMMEENSTEQVTFWNGGVALAVLRGALRNLKGDVEESGEESQRNPFCEYIRVCAENSFAPPELTKSVCDVLALVFTKDVSIHEAIALRHLGDENSKHPSNHTRYCASEFAASRFCSSS